MPMPSLHPLKDDPVSIMPANCSLRIIFHNEPLRPFSGLLQMHRRVLMSDPRPATSSMILPDRKSDGLKGSIFKSVLRLRSSLTDFAPRDKVAGGMSHAVITNLPRSTSLFKSRNILCCAGFALQNPEIIHKKSIAISKVVVESSDTSIVSDTLQ